MTVKIVFGIYLLILGVVDIRTRRIPAFCLLVGLALSLFIIMFGNYFPWIQVLPGLLIGGIFLVLSKISKEKIGYGDSAIIMILGIACGYKQQLFTLFVAFFMAALCSMILIVAKKINRKGSLPFIPFLGVAYFICIK